MEGRLRVQAGRLRASRTDKYIVDQFSKSVNPKDGYIVDDYEDFRTKQVLEFLIPILYPEKPTQVTVTVENTVFGAYMGDCVRGSFYCLHLTVSLS